MCSPLALPAVLGHVLQGRVQAVGVVADVTVVTQQEAPRVAGLAARLAHRTLQAAPAFTQHHLGDLGQNDRGQSVASRAGGTEQDHPGAGKGSP